MAAGLQHRWMRTSLWAACGILIASALPGADHSTAEPGAFLSQAPRQELDSPQQRRLFQRQVTGVYKAQITPHWYHNNTRFWYRNDLADGKREFIRVDAEAGKREPAFDHEKAATSLSKAAGKDYAADQLPISEIEFVDDSAAIRFKIGTDGWRCDLKSYECTKVEATDAQKKEGAAAAQTTRENNPFESKSPWITEQAADESSLSPQVQDEPQDDRRGRRGGRQRGDDRQVRSPDEKWLALVRDHNIFIRPAEAGTDNKEGGGTSEKQLTTDGEEGNSYGMLNWSPDSEALVAFRIEPGDEKEVHLIESSPSGGGRAKLQSRPYPLPGDKFTAYELSLFDVASGKQTKPEVERIDFGRPRCAGAATAGASRIEKIDRGHQRFRLIEVDAHTGAARNLIDEKTDTFIWTAHRESDGISHGHLAGEGRRDHLRLRARRLAAPVPGRCQRREDQERDHARASTSSAASSGSTRRSGRSGSAPAAGTRTRTRTSSTTTASTSTAPAWSR